MWGRGLGKLMEVFANDDDFDIVSSDKDWLRCLYERIEQKGTEMGLKVCEEKIKYMRMDREKMNDDTQLTTDSRIYKITKTTLYKLATIFNDTLK